VGVTTVRSLDNFSFFNQQSLVSMGAGTALSAAGIKSIKIKNMNISVQDLISATQSYDLAMEFIKGAIRQYFSFIEKSEPNIAVSKAMANALGMTIRRIYKKASLISKSADKIANLFGADIPGDGLPSQMELESKLKGMKLLFNPPVVPFALGNWIAGIPPNNLIHWLVYVISEPIVIALEMNNIDLIKLLKEALFKADPYNPFSAPSINYESLCAIDKKKLEKENPVVKETQKTKGGEYLLPDGGEYKGYYHEHKDGTLMSEKKHGKKSQVLTKIYKRDDLEGEGSQLLHKYKDTIDKRIKAKKDDLDA